MYIAGVYNILYTTTACTNTAKTVSCAKNGGWGRSKIHLILHGFKVQSSVSNKHSRENSSFWWRSTPMVTLHSTGNRWIQHSYHSTIRQKSIDALRACWSTWSDVIWSAWLQRGVGIMGSRIQRSIVLYPLNARARWPHTIRWANYHVMRVTEQRHCQESFIHCPQQSERFASVTIISRDGNHGVSN